MATDRIRKWSVDPVPGTNGKVVNAEMLFSSRRDYGSKLDRVLRFQKASEKHAIDGLPVDPRACIEDRNYSYGKQTAERFNKAFTTYSAKISDEIEIQTHLDGVNHFILTPNGTTSSPDFTYAIFIPKPNPKDPQIVRALNALGIPGESKYSLLTIGAPKGALVDMPTKSAMEAILDEQILNPTELFKAHTAEVIYILLDDRRIAKFITLPKAVLGIRALPPLSTIDEYSPHQDALSAIDGNIDFGLITDTLTAFRHAAFGSPKQTA